MGTPTSMVHGSHSSASGQVECVVETPRASPALNTDQSEEGKANTRLFCYLCKIAVNSPSQLEEHNRGTKHKTILEARSGLGPIKAYPRLYFSSNPGHSAQERTFHCEICNVRVNSEPQLKQHISSRRHRDAVAGKSNPLVGHHKSLGSAELMSHQSTPPDGNVFPQRSTKSYWIQTPGHPLSCLQSPLLRKLSE
ncbi:zinc finger protein 385A-like isoform X2 [Colossoma macropomum]|uniref:zinc finger protein 385A-like isoform X2 n=1 Tax=Colossoma macropomum TaxID=42526 RepID=UPI001864042C|nr:zinc finger protein 385A-like isoform X2 [Colossoma macropomum]